MTDSIRPATVADLPAILAIHNEAIENTLSVWIARKVPIANREAWFAERHERNQPVLVADRDGIVLGYAAYADFRKGDGYRRTVESSVYIRHDMRRRGIGAALMGELIGIARGLSHHVMVAAIGLPNPGSVALHARLGFVEAGTLREVGAENGRWLDLRFMQLTLDAGSARLR